MMQHILNKIGDYLENIRWIITDGIHILFVLYVEQHATTYIESSLFDKEQQYTDPVSVLRYCRNTESVVYCQSSTKTVCNIDAVGNLIAELGAQYRQMFPRLSEIITTDVWYGTLRYHLIKNYTACRETLSEFINRVSDNWDISRTDCNVLDAPATGWYTVDNSVLFKGVQTERPQLMQIYLQYSGAYDVLQQGVSETLHDSCNSAYYAEMLYDYDEFCEQGDPWNASVKGLREKKFYITYTYDIVRTEYTNILLCILGKLGYNKHNIHKLEVDKLGRLYINDNLCNIKIPYEYLAGTPENVWKYVLGMSEEMFNDFVIEQQAREKEMYTSCGFDKGYICSVLQEQHIPRWGCLLDYRCIADLQHLTDIDIKPIAVACMMQRDLSLPWFEFYQRYTKLNMGHFKISGNVVDRRYKVQNEVLQLYAQLQSNICCG